MLWDNDCVSDPSQTLRNKATRMRDMAAAEHSEAERLETEARALRQSAADFLDLAATYEAAADKLAP